jgi:hypothetical protein
MTKRRHRSDTPPEHDAATRNVATKSEGAHEAAHPVMADFSQRFTAGEKLAKDLSLNFIKLYKKLKAGGYHNTEIDSIVAVLNVDCVPNYPEVLPASLYGNMAAGKSLTLSCILDTADISPDSDGLTRGTYLVHEFSGPDNDWQKPGTFEVKACYYARAEISDKVGKLCNQILDWLTYTNGDPDKEGMDPEATADELGAYKAALAYFRPVVCGSPQFATEDDLVHYFVREYRQYLSPHRKQDGIFSEAQETMMKIIEELMRIRKVVDGVERCSADSNEELSSALRALSVPDGHAGCQTWPLISKIEVHCYAPLLSNGLAVADTPGMMDSNQAVVEGARAYISRGGPVFIVTPIERCGENEELDRMLKDMYICGRQEQTFVVLTKVDQINKLTPEARRKLSPSHAAQIGGAEDEVINLDAEKMALGRQCATLLAQLATRQDALAEYMEKHARQAEVSVELAAAKNRIKQLQVEDRNLKAKAGLKDKFRKLVNVRYAPDLEVICVSGHEYKKHLEGATGDDAPYLTKEGTGIPELQRTILRVPAAQKFEILQTVCLHKLPRCFNDVIAALQKYNLGGHGNAAAKLRTRIQQAWAPYHESITSSLRKDLQYYFEQNVAKAFRELIDGGEWNRKAGNLIADWGKLRGTTFRAFCKRNGTFKPSNEPRLVIWNERIEAIFDTHIKAGFDKLSNEAAVNSRATSSSIAKLTKDLVRTLQSPPYRNLPGNKDLMNAIENANDGMLRSIKTVCTNFRRDIDKIRLNATSGDGTTESYVSRAMRDCYKKAADISPNTAHVKQVRAGVIREGLLGFAGHGPSRKVAVPSVVDTVAKYAQDDFAEKIDSAYKQLVDNLNQTLLEILRQFDLRYTETKGPVSKDAKHVDALLEAARHAVQELQGPVKAHLTACELHLKSAGHQQGGGMDWDDEVEMR